MTLSAARVLKTAGEIKTWRQSVGNKSIGFVPTMGALHEGHLSLLKKSGAENDITILSIFVNPTQFNQTQDLIKYPRTWETDLKLANEAAVDIIFFPSYDEIYPDDFSFSVYENDFSHILCGASRAGHFKGVLTVLLKLINLINPKYVYMGEKDYQQLELVKRMAQAFFLNSKIISCPTQRNADGLALSSRNARLSDADRKKASSIFKTISTAKSAEQARAQLLQSGFKIDYLVDIGNRRYVAAYLPSIDEYGEVRLIDNVEC